MSAMLAPRNAWNDAVGAVRVSGAGRTGPGMVTPGVPALNPQNAQVTDWAMNQGPREHVEAGASVSRVLAVGDASSAVRVVRRRPKLSTTFFAVALLAMILLTTGTVTAATSLTLSWSALSSSIKPGTYATATVKVTHGAKCGIVVRYSTTVSHAAGLITKTAPATGRLSWHWKVGTNTHKGTWRVTVTCTLGKLTKSIWRTMTIT